MNEPLVSILIPVYNAGAYLRPSVQSILSQTYSNLEILIIDDGSTDGCMDSIADLDERRIRIITKKNGGRATALNAGLEALSGDFYATHDADDVSHRRRIESQVGCMLENPQLAAVFTGYDLILNGRQTAPRTAAKNVQQCREDVEHMRMPSHDPTGMWRVSTVRDVRYEPRLRVGAGFDYILRTGEFYPMIVLGDCLYSYRAHYTSTTRANFTLRKRMVLEVLSRACERRGLELDKRLAARIVSHSSIEYRQREVGVVTHFMESVLDLRRARRHWRAVKTALACLRLHPYDLYYYKPLAYCVAPLTLIGRYRTLKTKGK
jgi:glycosyltransferase involved in cell wall biosynthesis